jgi:hypothetical protein
MGHEKMSETAKASGDYIKQPKAAPVVNDAPWDKFSKLTGLPIQVTDKSFEKSALVVPQAKSFDMCDGVVVGGAAAGQISNVYGYCPRCGALGITRERRPNGNDRCSNGHEYPTRDACKTNTGYLLAAPAGWTDQSCDIVQWLDITASETEHRAHVDGQFIPAVREKLLHTAKRLREASSLIENLRKDTANAEAMRDSAMKANEELTAEKLCGVTNDELALIEAEFSEVKDAQAQKANAYDELQSIAVRWEEPPQVVVKQPLPPEIEEGLKKNWKPVITVERDERWVLFIKWINANAVQVIDNLPTAAACDSIQNGLTHKWGHGTHAFYKHRVS